MPGVKLMRIFAEEVQEGDVVGSGLGRYLVEEIDAGYTEDYGSWVRFHSGNGTASHRYKNEEVILVERGFE